MNGNQSMEMVMAAPRRGGLLKKLLPLVVLAAGAVAFFALGLDRYVTFESLRENREGLKLFVELNGLVAVVLYIAIYATAVAFSLPGGAIMTLAGGFLFGAAFGTIYVVIAATVGAAALFLIARSTLGSLLRAKAGPFVRKLEDGFKDNALSYLLVLRLVPAFPFWVVNLVPALLGVKLSTYIIGTAIGIIPGSFVFATFGAGLGAIFDSGAEVSLKAVLTPEIIAGLVGLALLALIPVVIKKLRGRAK